MGTTTDSSESGGLDANHAYSGKAIIALAIGVVAVFLPAPLNIAAAAAGFVAALLSRRAIQKDPHLRGTALSLIAFLVCGGVLVFGILGIGLSL